MTRDYISATELCTKLGVTKMSLWRWEKSDNVGLPKPARINGVRFYPVAEVESWLQQARG